MKTIYFIFVIFIITVGFSNVQIVLSQENVSSNISAINQTDGSITKQNDTSLNENDFFQDIYRCENIKGGC